MTDFTARHDDQLHEYFAGVLVGRCGLRSYMGGMLEAQASSGVHGSRRNGEFMLVAPENRHVNRDFDVSEDMRAAARAINRIERALRRLEVEQVRILRAHYEDAGKAAFRKLAVVLGDTAAHDLERRRVSEDRDVKREAKREYDSAVDRARVAIEAAQEAYARADEDEATAAREERKRRFEANFA